MDILSLNHGGVRTAVAVLLAFTLTFAMAPQAAADEVTQARAVPKALKLDGYYMMLTPSGNAIALADDSIKNGVKFVLKANSKKPIGRQFFFTPSSKGYHSIKNSISFKALSVRGGSTKNGAGFVQNAYKKAKNQRYKFVPAGDGWFFLKNMRGSYVSVRADKPGNKLIVTTDRTKALKLRVRKTEYSSGLPELDKKIRKIRKEIGGKGDTMKKVWKYVAEHYDYRDHANDFNGNWIARYAYSMIDQKRGHCKNFAATLCVLYRSYGYDARVVTGYVQSRSRGWAVHGWTEVTINGKRYTFDPSFYNSRGDGGWYKRAYQDARVKYKVEKRW
jgi:hypothetical protein